MRTAAYWSEFTREAIEGGSARVLPGYELTEMLSPVQILVQGKEKRKGEWKVRKGMALYVPGQVIHRRERDATEWELEEWQGLPEGQLQELGVRRQNGVYRVAIASRIKDLPAAIRQQQRHVFASKIARTRQRFVLEGNAYLLRENAQQLSTLLQRILQQPRIGLELSEEVAEGTKDIVLRLAGKRTALQQNARAELEAAPQGRFPEAAVHVSRAITDLLEEHKRDYEIAAHALELAASWSRLLLAIERRFRNCYQRLGLLGQQTQRLMQGAQGNDPAAFLPIAREAYGIWRHLTERVPNFLPYSERLQQYGFQRLSRAVQHVEEKEISTLLEDLKGGVAALEKIATREKPTLSELARMHAALL